MYVRVAVTGRILIVTVTGASSTATTPVGRASLASTVSSSDTPVIEMGSVSTRVRSTSWSASPATRTTWGSTVTESISKPAAGTPVMMALTGRVRLCWSEKTGMTTRAVCGVTSSGRSSLPSLSTGTSWTSSSRSMPVDWIVTSARTESTWSTIEAAPDTVTTDGSTVVGPRVNPSGVAPWATLTGTSCLVFSWSSWIVMNCGS